MRVFIIDHHVLFREGLVSLLSKEPDFEIIGEADNAKDAIVKVIDKTPDLVLIDAALPFESSLETLREIKSHSPNTKIVLLTLKESDYELLETIKAGACGYLQKNISISKLLASLRAIERGETAISRKATSRILDEFRRMSHLSYPQIEYLETLTGRELEILIQLGKGGSNTEIAERMRISKNTVKIHIYNMMKKLGLRNRREAGEIARRLKLVD